MRQDARKCHKSIRSYRGIWATHGLFGVLFIAFMMLGSASAYGQSQPQTQQQPPTQTQNQPTGSANATQEDGAMTREQILAVFQQEARAAYQMNKEACSGLSADEQKICLARARLQFDADMRYAQKRADQGY